MTGRNKTYKVSETHGLSRAPEHAVWLGMRQRCEYRRHISYKNYGARGIKVCKRWHDFAAFYQDMGPRPSPKHMIERNDNDGPYAPKNCIWAIQEVQKKNKRKRRDARR